MSSPQGAATFDARAAYAARVDGEASRSAARRDSSSGGAEDPWVMDAGSVIWTMGGLSVGEAEPWPREDMEISPQAMGVRKKSASFLDGAIIPIVTALAIPIAVTVLNVSLVFEIKLQFHAHVLEY